MIKLESNAVGRVGSLLFVIAIGVAPLAARAASASSPPNGEVLALQGTAGLPSCASCHGARFEGNKKLGAPALAGKNAAATMDALYTMATNPNDHSPMAKIARQLNMAERAAVTAWLSRLSPTEP